MGNKTKILVSILMLISILMLGAVYANPDPTESDQQNQIPITEQIANQIQPRELTDQ